MSGRGPALEVRSKIWLEIDGEPVFGGGREELLRLVRKNGSINAAAREIPQKRPPSTSPARTARVVARNRFQLERSTRRRVSRPVNTAARIKPAI